MYRTVTPISSLSEGVITQVVNNFDDTSSHFDTTPDVTDGRTDGETLRQRIFENRVMESPHFVTFCYAEQSHILSGRTLNVSAIGTAFSWWRNFMLLTYRPWSSSSSLIGGE